MNSSRIHLFFALPALLFAGCKAAPAPNSGFLEEGDRMAKVARNPFQRSWFDHKIDPNKYTELLVQPVNMKYVMAQNIWEQANLRKLTDFSNDFNEIAKYTQQTFIQTAQVDPRHRFTVVDKAGPKTAVLELAIVQLVPTKAAQNLIGLVAPVGSVMALQIAGGAMTGTEEMGKGLVAIEGRVRDGSTGEVIFMFSDREAGKSALFDMTAFSWWGPAKLTINDWADEFVRLAGTPADQKVKEATSFELLIW